MNERKINRARAIALPECGSSTTFNMLLDKIPADIVGRLTAEQLVDIVLLMFNEYELGFIDAANCITS